MRVLQFFVASGEPIQLTYFSLQLTCFLLFPYLSPLKLAYLPIPISLPDNFIDLGPFVGLPSMNQDQSLSYAVGAGSTAGPMDVE